MQHKINITLVINETVNIKTDAQFSSTEKSKICKSIWIFVFC